MTDLSSYSNEELLALYNNPVSQTMPALIAQESGGRAGVLGPQTRYGRAEGLTQMLPATAQEMAGKLGVPWRPELMRGTTPEAAEYQRTLGEAYLQEGFDRTGNIEDALRYYHGGPNRELWGPKTEAYVQQVTGRAEPQNDLSSLSNEELLAMYQQEAPKAAPAAPKPVQALPKKDQALGFEVGMQPAARRISDATGLVARAIPGAEGIPLRALSALGSEAYRASKANTDQARAEGRQPGVLGQIAGGVVATLPTMAMGPLAGGAASGYLLSEADDPLGVLRDVAIGAVAGKVADKAVKGLGKLPKIMSRDELATARTAAYQAVDNAGVRYKKEAFQELVRGIGDELRAGQINPKLHARSTEMLRYVQKMSGKSPTLTELDQLRQIIRRDVVASGDPAEKMFGQKMIKNIDEFIEAAGPEQVVAGDPVRAAQSIKTARDFHMRLKKLDEIEEALGKADLRAASTGSGGNVDNATRQNVRRVLENSKNYTPAERKAAEKVIRGTPTQNTLRTMGKLSPQGNGLMTALSIGGTAANPLLAIPSMIGLGAKAAADAMTKSNVDDLMRIIINGGSLPARVAPGVAVRAPVTAGAVTVAAQPAAAQERKNRRQ